MPYVGATEARGRGIVRALRRVGEVTGRPVAIATKEDRIRIQKLVYLLKVSDYGPARKFDFNLYQNGPYSPSLTEVYYQFGTEGISSATPAVDLPPATLDMVKDADAKGVLFLEALATALDTISSTRREARQGAPLVRGMNWAQAIKPHIDESVWREVREFLRTHPGLAGSS